MRELLSYIIIITIQSLALHQIKVVGLLKDSVFEASTESFQICIVNVEHMTLHTE